MVPALCRHLRSPPSTPSTLTSRSGTHRFPFAASTACLFKPVCLRKGLWRCGECYRHTLRITSYIRYFDEHISQCVRTHANHLKIVIGTESCLPKATSPSPCWQGLPTAGGLRSWVPLPPSPHPVLDYTGAEGSPDSNVSLMKVMGDDTHCQPCLRRTPSGGLVLGAAAYIL